MRETAALTVRYCSGFYIRVYLHMHEHTTAGKEVTNIQEHSHHVIIPLRGGYKIETFCHLFFLKKYFSICLPSGHTPAKATGNIHAVKWRVSPSPGLLNCRERVDFCWFVSFPTHCGQILCKNGTEDESITRRWILKPKCIQNGSASMRIIRFNRHKTALSNCGGFPNRLDHSILTLHLRPVPVCGLSF